ncbi:MAG: ACP S-malonyltransferase [Ktedonobacteraceae bacterium]
MTAQVAFLFPGQGSQAVGMGADVYAASPAAKSIFETVDAALGFSLSNLCFQGPEETLRETINAQPAIVTVSLALLAAFQESLSPTHTFSSWSSPLVPSYTAGHSVGEYAALVAADALDLSDVARLVRERGSLMHHEGTVCPGGMAAIIGMDADALEAVCQEATAQASAEASTSAMSGTEATHPGMGKVIIANFNAPGQIVISGEQRALQIAMERAKARGAKRVIPLAVSGAFHSPVMQPAASTLAKAIHATALRNATIPIIGNISAKPLTTATAISEELAQQIAASVQWTRTIEYLVNAGVTVFIEIGPGEALTGMLKRTAKGVTMFNIGTMADIEQTKARIQEMGLSRDV